MKKLFILLALLALTACTEVNAPDQNEQPQVTTAPVVTTTTAPAPVIPVDEIVKAGITLQCGEISRLTGPFPFVIHEVTIQNETDLEVAEVAFALYYVDADGKVAPDEETGEEYFAMTLYPNEPFEAGLLINPEAVKAMADIVSVTLTDGTVVEY